jgi:thioredoxin reductase (NADPH)
MTAALHLAQFSPTVYLLVRGQELGGEPIWRRQVRSHPAIKILYQTEIAEILGENKVAGIKLTRPYESREELPVEGVFVEIGADPDVSLAEDLGVKLNTDGYIEVSESMATNIPGVFAAGDVTGAYGHLDQIVSAEAGGGLAARSAFWRLSNENMNKSKGSLLRRILGR